MWKLFIKQENSEEKNKTWSLGFHILNQILKLTYIFLKNLKIHRRILQIISHYTKYFNKPGKVNTITQKTNFYSPNRFQKKYNPFCFEKFQNYDNKFNFNAQNIWLYFYNKYPKCLHVTLTVTNVFLSRREDVCQYSSKSKWLRL